MTTTNEDMPEFMKPGQPPADEEVWSRIEADFLNLRDLIEHTRLETREEAIGQDLSKNVQASRKADWRDTAPKSYDPETDQEVRHSSLSPYIDSVDQEYLRTLYDGAKQLIPKIATAISERALTPQFLRDWGTFCWAAGGAEIIYLADADDISHIRRGLSKTENKDTAHLRWYANYVKREMDAGRNRKQPDDVFRQLVSHLLWTPVTELSKQEQVFVESVGADWIQEFLVEDEDEGVETLKSKYSGKHLYGEKFKRALTPPTDDLPDLSLKIPEF